jgi:hypothetical protein
MPDGWGSDYPYQVANFVSSEMNFVQLEDRNVADEVFYVIGWASPAVWGGLIVSWLLRTDDLGQTWTWMLISDIDVTAGWKYPDSSVIRKGYGSANIWHSPPVYDCGPGAAQFTEILEVSGSGNATGPADGNYAGWTLHQYDCWENYIAGFEAEISLVVDFGQVYQAQQIEILGGKVSGCWSFDDVVVETSAGGPSYYYAIAYNASIESQDPYGYPGGHPAGWTLIANTQWLKFKDPLPWSWFSLYNNPGSPLSLRYLYLDMDGHDPLTPIIPCSGVKGVDTVRIYTGAPTYSVQVLGLAVDFRYGSYVYVTYKDLDANIVYIDKILVADDGTMTVTQTEALASGANAALYPRVVYAPNLEPYWDWEHIVYCYGAVDVGADVTGSLLRSHTEVMSFSQELDAATQAALLATDDYVSAVAMYGDGSGALMKIYVFCSNQEIYSATPDYFFNTSPLTWAYEGDLPFVIGRFGLSVGYDVGLTTLFGNAVAAGAAQITSDDEPYTTPHIDRTGDYGTGWVSAMEWITPWIESD